MGPIELPKELGGLGAGNILEKNLILLFKWWWIFSKEDNVHWKSIVCSVHKIKGLKAPGECFKDVKESLWKQLVEKEDIESKIREIMEDGLQIKVGKREYYPFWTNTWSKNLISLTLYYLYITKLQN